MHRLPFILIRLFVFLAGHGDWMALWTVIFVVDHYGKHSFSSQRVKEGILGVAVQFIRFSKDLLTTQQETVHFGGS